MTKKRYATSIIPAEDFDKLLKNKIDIIGQVTEDRIKDENCLQPTFLFLGGKSILISDNKIHLTALGRAQFTAGRDVRFAVIFKKPKTNHTVVLTSTCVEFNIPD